MKFWAKEGRVVITFVPYDDAVASAKALDSQRLGKQRSEALQILRALTTHKTSKWAAHPASRMWRGYEQALKVYLSAVMDEWMLRGFVCNMEYPIVTEDVVWPWWWGMDLVHGSHRRSLVKKNQKFYREKFPGEPAIIQYVWPVKTDGSKNPLLIDCKRVVL